MRRKILEIVVILIDYIKEDKVPFANLHVISDDLKAQGYTDNEISSAYSWLMDRYDNAPEQYFSEIPSISSSNRILSDREKQILSPDAYGFLIKLRNFSLIDNEQFEMIIDKINLLSLIPVNTEQVKMIASSVIFREVDEIERITMPEKSDDPPSFIN